MENAHDPVVQDFIVRKLRYRPMEEILEDPRLKALERRLVDEQQDLVELLLQRFERRGRVAVFDLTETPIERHNKLMPYMMFSEIDHAVALLKIGGLIKLSIGSNPWSARRLAPNLARLAERYGGGGHAAVAGIALGPEGMVRARRIVSEIACALDATPSPSPSNSIT